MTEKHLSSQFDSELNRVSARVMELGGLVESQIRQAVYALSRFSIEAVEQVDAAEKRVNAMEVEIDHEFDGFVRKLVTYMMEDPRTISASLDLLFLAKAIERIGDHSKNVAELIIYLVEGKDVRHQTMDAIESAVL